MLETKRLILRGLKEEDLEIFLSIVNSEYVKKYNVMREMVHQDFLNLLNDKSGDYWAIEVKSNEEFVGIIHKNRDSIRYNVNSAELSFWLSEEYSGQGIMYEALSKVIEELFYERQVDSITVRIFEDNHASVRLIEKLGFDREGRLVDAVRGFDGVVHNDLLYSMKKNEYFNNI